MYELYWATLSIFDFPDAISVFRSSTIPLNVMPSTGTKAFLVSSEGICFIIVSWSIWELLYSISSWWRWLLVNWLSSWLSNYILTLSSLHMIAPSTIALEIYVSSSKVIGNEFFSNCVYCYTIVCRSVMESDCSSFWTTLTGKESWVPYLRGYYVNAVTWPWVSTVC